MVSVGIQNQVTTGSGQGAGSKKKNKPRTIMCMDFASQTGIAI